MWKACITCLGKSGEGAHSGEDIGADSSTASGSVSGDVNGKHGGKHGGKTGGNDIDPAIDHRGHVSAAKRSAQAGWHAHAASGSRHWEAATHLAGSEGAPSQPVIPPWRAGDLSACTRNADSRPRSWPGGQGGAGPPEMVTPQAGAPYAQPAPASAPAQPSSRSALPLHPLAASSHGPPGRPARTHPPPIRAAADSTATVHHPRLNVLPTALSRLLSRPAPALELREVDLSYRKPDDLLKQELADREALAARCERLHLPDGCSAALVRLWLRASPKLRDVTAADIDDDGKFLSALQLEHLRYFRTTPPGPRGLSIGLQSQVVVPQDRVTPPDRARLRAWVHQPDALPLLSEEDFARVQRHLDRYLFEPASRMRKGIWIVGTLQQAMLDLMQAAPAELLSGVAAQNYHTVQARVARAWHHCMSYGEFLNFLRPTLLACWQVVAAPREPSGHTLRSREDVWRGAVLRHWVLSAPEGESVGERERIAASLVKADRLQDPDTLQSLLLEPAPLLDDGSQMGSSRGTASQPVSPASPGSPDGPGGPGGPESPAGPPSLASGASPSQR